MKDKLWWKYRFEDFWQGFWEGVLGVVLLLLTLLIGSGIFIVLYAHPQILVVIIPMILMGVVVGSWRVWRNW